MIDKKHFYKSFPLFGIVGVAEDMTDKNLVWSFSDISSKNLPYKIDIAHIIRMDSAYDDESKYYGKNMRLNISERLISEGDIQYYVDSVVSIERKLQGGEVITYDYYAHVNDEATGDTIRLKMIENEEKIQMSIHKQCRYSFLYLPHTKYAVITETFSYIGENEAEVNFPLNRTDKSP